MNNDTRNLLRVAADLLDLAEEQFSNHGCNDYEMDDTEENVELVEAFSCYEGGSFGRDWARGKLLVRDDMLMAFCAVKLRELAKGEQDG